MTVMPPGEAELHAGVDAYDDGDVPGALEHWIRGMELGHDGCAHNVGVVITEQSDGTSAWLHLAHAMIDGAEHSRPLVESTRPAFDPFDDMVDAAMFDVDPSGQATAPAGHLPARDRLLHAAEQFGWSVYPAGGRALVGGWTTPHDRRTLIVFSLSQSPRGPWSCHVSCAGIAVPPGEPWRLRPAQRRFVDAVGMLAGLGTGDDDSRGWFSLATTTWLPIPSEGSYAEVGSPVSLLTLGYDVPMQSAISPLPYLDHAVTALLAAQDVMGIAFESSRLLWSAFAPGVPGCLVDEQANAFGISRSEG